MRKNPIFVALDVEPLRAVDLIDQLHDLGVGFKVGTATGIQHQATIVKNAKLRGAPVFLDCKWANTPDVVAAAVREAVEMGIDLCNVMIGDNGPESIKSAVEAARGSQTQVIGVTVLTTRDKHSLQATGVEVDDVSAQVMLLANLANRMGLHGVVASAQEVKTLRAHLGRGFRLTIPGITFGGTTGSDQKRTGTPRQALDDGATDLVIGSAIYKSADPRATTEAIIESLELS